MTAINYPPASPPGPAPTYKPSSGRKSWEEIVSIMTQRRLAMTPLLTAMVKVRDRFNGDYVIPMPNTSDENVTTPAIPAVIANAIENTALRAGSTSPAIMCPAIDDTEPTGRNSLEYAGIRKRALAYTWAQSSWNLGVRRSYRHLAGYYTAAIDVRWNFDRGCPDIKALDPLSAFPEPRAPEDLSPPDDIGYIYAKSVDWLRRNYPETQGMVGRSGLGGTSGDMSMWELVEWVDEYDIVVGVLGPQVAYRSQMAEPLRHVMELRRYPNRAGRCTTYIPRRVTLDRLANQVANMVGTTDLMAKLVALDIRATELSVFPDRYIVGKQGQAPTLVGGRWKEGSTGEVNIILDAENVGMLRGSPDQHNSMTIDRLERNANITMGVTPQQVGETYGALRTGRGIDTLMGAAVDPRIQELHEIMQVAMTSVNEVVIDSYKGYAPNRKYVAFSSWPTDRGQVSFIPAKHFETTNNAVLYPLPGMDIQTATIVLGQLYGTGAISLATLRQLHPYVTDGDSEERLRLIEKLTESGQDALFQRASQGGIPPSDMARIIQLVKEGKSWEDAVTQADQEAQVRQAQQAPPAPPGMAVPPGTMPGLGNPGEGGQMQPGQDTVPTPALGLDHFRQMVRNLNAPNAGVGVNARPQ